MIKDTWLREIFSSFSRRHNIPKERKILTPAFKARAFMLCQERHPANHVTDMEPGFWAKIHKKLRYQMAEPRLSRSHSNSQLDDIAYFLRDCSDEIFLDFIEFVFQVQSPYSSAPHKLPDPNSRQPYIDHILGDLTPREGGHVFPSEINTFFDLCELPYSVTDYTWEIKTGKGKMYHHLVAYPQIVIRDSEAIHEMAIEPSLKLLQAPRWKTANEEFLKALQHYRKKEWADCVAMCASSLESVMKIVCKEKGWEENPDTLQASQLLKIVVNESDLDPYYVKLLELPHVIRNTKSNVHGRGNTPTTIPRHIAKFVVNMTASTILLFTEEANL